MLFGFLLSIIFSFANAEHIAFDIKPEEFYCVGEYLSFGSYTKITITVSQLNTPFALTISNETKSIKKMSSLEDTKRSITHIEYSFTPFNSSEVTFCIKNLGEYAETFDFHLVEGVEATEYQEIFGKKNWTDVEEKTRRVWEEITVIRKKYIELEIINDSKMGHYDNLAIKIFVIGVTTMVIIMVLGCLQLQIMMKFFRHKKLI